MNPGDEPTGTGPTELDESGYQEALGCLLSVACLGLVWAVLYCLVPV